MKRTFPRIANRIYREVWAILPSMHESIRRQFEAHVKGVRADMPDPDAEEDLEESEPSTQGTIGVIPVYGILGNKLSMLETQCGGVDVEDLAEQIKAFRDDTNVSCLVLDFDSPGGCVTGIPELATLISETDAVKPVYAFSAGQCCSAAYWLASQCRSIVVTGSSAIGSIGAYIYLEDHSRELDMAGIKPNPIVSDASPLKLAGADFKPLTDAERALFQADVNDIYTDFVEAISAKRTVQADFLKGQVVSGEQAVEAGFADGLANDMDEMLSLVAT